MNRIISYPIHVAPTIYILNHSYIYIYIIIIYPSGVSPLQTPIFYTELILSRYVLTCFDIPSLTLDHLRSPAAPRFASPLPGVELRQWPLMARGLQALPGAALAAFGWRALGGGALRQERLRISGRRIFTAQSLDEFP